MRFLLFLSIFASAPAALAADGCTGDWFASLQVLKNSKADPDFRSKMGQCLVRHHLDQADAAQEILQVIKNKDEDLFLREDLVEALAEAPWRKQIRVESEIAPKVNNQEKEALGRTIAGAQDILSLAQQVKSMKETVATTRYEPEFFRVLSELSLDDSTHVILRSHAVATLESLAKRTVESGVFNDKSLRMAQESLQLASLRDDTASQFSGAGAAYGRMAKAGMPHFAGPSRSIASEPKK